MSKIVKSKTSKDSKSSHLAKSGAEEIKDQLKRALADYHNLEKRVEEERSLFGQLTSAVLIEKLLPVLDNLESAQSHLNDQGLAMVIRQFKDVIVQEGVEEITAVGVQFDPKLHEATEVTEGQNDNLIVKTLRKGYKINDKVLRPAQVTVERKKVDQELEKKSQKTKDFGDYA